MKSKNEIIQKIKSIQEQIDLKNKYCKDHSYNNKAEPLRHWYEPLEKQLEILNWIIEE